MGSPSRRRACACCGASGAQVRACRACHSVAYCGRECQKRDWRRHKPQCRAAAAALEAATDTWLNPPQREAYDPALAEAMARGEPHVAEVEAAGGWTVRTTKARILKNSNTDGRDNTHIGWKRDLSLTLHAGQELPNTLFGGNSLELWHGASGVRLRLRQQRSHATAHTSSPRSSELSWLRA